MHFEVEASLIGQTHNFSKDVPDGLGEERVEDSVNEFGVTITRMLIQDDMVLHKEVRDIVVQIDILADNVQADKLLSTVYRETHQVRRRFLN